MKIKQTSCLCTYWSNEYKVWDTKSWAVTLSTNVVLVEQIVPVFNINVTILCCPVSYVVLLQQIVPVFNINVMCSTWSYLAGMILS